MDDLALHDPALLADGFPHELFRELRASQPVSHVDHPGFHNGCWAVVRHADVQRVSRDPATFKNSPTPFIDPPQPGDDGGMSELLVSKDPPDHTKLRLLISKGFTPRRVSELADRIEARVDSILAALADRTTCDLVDDVSMWLPLHVIADLVGVPEADRRQVFDWTERTFGFDGTLTREERGQAAIEMFAYADALCAERRAEPRDDLMSALVEAEVEGERLTQMQIDLFFMLLQNAGSETTRNLITTGTLTLLDHPDDMERLRADLSLLPSAIEELLRWVSPVVQFVRHAAVDTEVGGQRIAAGEHVSLVYPSANRDDAVFDDPFRLDLSRTPNDHVAFGGGGPHFCLGANLARMEARIMFEALLTRFDGLEVDGAVETLPRLHSNLIDGYAHVPIKWRKLT